MELKPKGNATVQAMSKMIIYETFTIRSTPLRVWGIDEWKVEIVIAGERAGAVTERPFAVGATYQTEEEADIQGLTFGQRIIDGKVPRLSVN